MFAIEISYPKLVLPFIAQLPCSFPVDVRVAPALYFSREAIFLELYDYGPFDRAVYSELEPWHSKVSSQSWQRQRLESADIR